MYKHAQGQKGDADAMHHGGLAGCDLDPGPQGLRDVQKIMSISKHM